MWVWIIATVLAYFVKGLSGFANTLVFTSILGFAQNNVNISPVELGIGTPSNVIMTIRYRKHLIPKVYISLTFLVLAGSLPGAFLLKNVNAQYIKIVFGVIVILLGIEMFMRDAGKMVIKDSKVFPIIIGLLSGILCGLFGVGALLAAYIGRATETADEFKANISAVFLADNIFRIIVYSVLHVLTFDTLKMSLILIPFMLIGLYLGMLSGRFLNDKMVKKIVIILLIISGISLIATNL